MPGRAALTRPVALGVALAFAAVIFAIPVARAPIWEPNDARYVLLAQDIVEHGHWLVPEVRGVHGEGLYKPQLYSWSLALASLPFGRVTELTAALPSVAAAVGGVAGVVAIACLLWNVRAGLLAGLILATTPGYFVFAQRSLPDVMLTAWIIWALYFLLRTRPEGSLRSLLGFYGCVGGAMLSKGPVGLAALAAALVATWMTDGRSGLRSLRLGLGALLLGLMATVWVLPYLLAEPRAFVSDVVVGEYGVWFFQKHGLLYRAAHMPSVLLYFAPWTPYLAGAVVWWWRAVPDAGRRRVLGWTMTLWVLVGLSGIYRDRYYLPVYPGLALLTAQFFAEASADVGRRLLRIGSAVFVVLALAGAALMTLSVTPSGDGAVYWPDRVWERGLIALLLTLGVVQVWRLVRREAFVGVAVSVALVLGAIEAVEGVTAPLRRARDYDVPALAAIAAAHVPPDGSVIGYPDLSLEWDVYLRRPVREIGSTDGVVRILGQPSKDVVIMTAPRWAEVAGRAGPGWRVLAAHRIGDREMVVVGCDGCPQGALEPAKN
jgi:4-amino-4-deoxy-L-arabinose transferase-like glycosyltransferase